MIVNRGSILILFLAMLIAPAWSAEESEPVAPPPPTNEPSAEALQQYLQKQERANLVLQDKLQTLQWNLEETRAQAEAAARRNAETLATRLRVIEQTLTANRDREIETMQKSNRFLLTVAGVFGCVGIFAMVFTAWFLLRAMNRLAEVAAVFPPSMPHATIGLEAGRRELPALPAEGNRLLGAIDRLEKRIYQLEHTASAAHGDEAVSNGNSTKLEIVVSPTGSLGEHDRFPAVLAKGESLLEDGDSDGALACFDEALAIKPGEPATLVKKGTALERLKRWEEALDCYNQAIAADESLTLAYLYKGGVYNQLEKFSEALECYEQALRTQQKQPA